MVTYIHGENLIPDGVEVVLMDNRYEHEIIFNQFNEESQSQADRDAIF